MTEANAQPENAGNALSWTGVSLADIDEVDLGASNEISQSSDCVEIGRLYRAAAEAASAGGHGPSTRIFAFLSELAGFHTRFDSQNDPYGPMFVMDGRRSSIPDDFRGPPVEVIARLAVLSSNLAMKARLSDVSWLLEKKRVDSGKMAIAAYSELVQQIASGELSSKMEPRNRATGSFIHGLVRRGLTLASFKSLVSDASGRSHIEAAARTLIGLALGGTDPFAVQRFQKIALQYGISTAEKVAVEIETWLDANAECDERGRLELLRQAASAYRQAKTINEYHRLKLLSVNLLEQMAEHCVAGGGSAMLAASHLSDAIAELHGLPNIRELRDRLKQRLEDVQQQVLGEMQPYSQEMDLSDIAEEAEALMHGKSLRDMLFQIASLERSPRPSDLREAAVKSIAENPISNIFSASYLDRDGKVTHRAPGLDLNKAPSDEAIQPTIARAEDIRRSIFVKGSLQAALNVLNETYSLCMDELFPLLRNSVFVPEELRWTYAKGVLCFLRRDVVSAVYILTPLLEASVKKLLQARGHQVSTFDNATQTQQDLTISALFDQMRPQINQVLGEANSTDIENVFLRKPGPSIRHGIAHGLMTDGDPYGADAVYSCWLVFRLILLPLFPHRDKFSEDLI